MIDASRGQKAAGGVAAERGGVGGEDDGDGVGDAVLRALFHAMQVEQTLDAPAAIGGGDVSRIEITGGIAGMIEVIDFADVKLAAGIQADAGGDGLAVFFHRGQDGGGAGGKLLAGPGFVEALLGENFQQEREMRVVGVGYPMD